MKPALTHRPGIPALLPHRPRNPQHSPSHTSKPGGWELSRSRFIRFSSSLLNLHWTFWTLKVQIVLQRCLHANHVFTTVQECLHIMINNISWLLTFPWSLLWLFHNLGLDKELRIFAFQNHQTSMWNKNNTLCLSPFAFLPWSASVFQSGAWWWPPQWTFTAGFA